MREDNLRALFEPEGFDPDDDATVVETPDVIVALFDQGSMESSCEKRDSAGHPQKIPVGSRSISSSSLAISVVGAAYL